MALPWSSPMHEARYYHAESEKVRCELCPRNCLLGEQQRGRCGVRFARQGRLWTDVYGGVSSLAVDPIEKKPFYHVKPGSRSLSFGTLGCTLSCAFCQNHAISQPPLLAPMAQMSIPDILEQARECGCSSVALTYNEPIVSAEWSLDIAKACREAGLLVLAVTSGHIGDRARRDFFESMDAANVDLKSFDPDFYRRHCHGCLEAVLESLVHCHRSRIWLEVTTLLIPGLNDDPQEIRKMSEWFLKNLGPDVPLHFSAFHPRFLMLDRAPTPLGTLQMAGAMAKEVGIRHVYLGNIQGQEGQDTFCPNCGKRLVQRMGFRVLENGIRKGQCPECQTEIPGIF